MYLFYVDESGSPAVSQAKDGGDVLALVAIGMLDHKWRGFNHTLHQSKRTLFEKNAHESADCLEVKDYEIKSNWLRLPKERKNSRLLRTLSAESLDELTAQYYQQLEHNNMAIIAIVIDKMALPAYFDDQVKIYRKAWELLCERIENLMRERHPNHKAIIIADDCGKTQNYRLVSKYAYFLETQTTAGVQFRHIAEMPLFTRSELSEGIQLADLCAYNIYRAFTDRNMNYSYFQKIAPYFYRSANTNESKVDGLKVFPNESYLQKLIFAAGKKQRRASKTHPPYGN